jgi:transcriptional regulator with XRE-family HTH domain
MASVSAASLAIRIGQTVRIARLNAHETQADVAEALNYSASVFAAMERGEQEDMRIGTALRLLTRYGYTLSITRIPKTVNGQINGTDASSYDPYDPKQASGLWSPGFTAAIDKFGNVRSATAAEKAEEHKEFARKGAAQRKDQDERAREAERASQEKKVS